jgi:hypothetical protein
LSLLAQRPDFEPATPAEGSSALYYNPADGGGYHEYPFFAARVAQLRGFAAPNNQKLAVWGCGFGYLVNQCVAAGYDAHGYDASSYAITRGQALLPAIAARLHVRSALVSGDMTPARRDAGLQGAQKFALLVTEDLLTCMSDPEITTALTNLRGVCSANLLHILTLADATTAQDSRLNWKTAAAWKARLSPPDVVADENGTVV